MKDIFLLTKVLIKSSKSNTKKLNTKLISKFFTFLVFLFVYCYLAGIFVYISYEIITSLMLFNKPEIFLNICFIALLGFSIFQSVFTALNVLFFSKDLDKLLPLPIKPYKIIIAKFNCLVFSQYIMYFVVAFPALIVYGYLLKLGVLYYIYMVLLLLTFPVIPVAIVSLLLNIIMKFTKIIRNKETLQYITSIVAILIIVLVQFTIGTTNEEITNEELAQRIMTANSSIENTMPIVFNVKNAVTVLENFNNVIGLKIFLKFILESFSLYLVTSIIMSKFYVKTVTNLMSKGSKNKAVEFTNKIYKSKKVGKAYFIKEVKNLIRNPIFFMQCVLPPFLFPLIFLVPSIMSILNQGEEAQIIIEFISNYINTTVGLIGTIEIIELLYIFNFATITSISRDGSDAKVIKYLPIDLSKQLVYKSFIGILFNLVPLIYVIFILKIGLNANYLTLTYITILAILINIFNNFLVILVDLINPKIDWITEYAVVKQNLNMFYQMLIIVTEMALLFIAFKIKNISICFAVLAFIFILLIILVKLYTNKNKEKLFEKIY